MPSFRRKSQSSNSETQVQPLAVTGGSSRGSQSPDKWKSGKHPVINLGRTSLPKLARMRVTRQSNASHDPVVIEQSDEEDVMEAGAKKDRASISSPKILSSIKDTSREFEKSVLAASSGLSQPCTDAITAPPTNVFEPRSSTSSVAPFPQPETISTPSPSPSPSPVQSLPSPSLNLIKHSYSNQSNIAFDDDSDEFENPLHIR